jgi:enoyl-[acyl-carrier-protein] reductase (NADH)
MSRLEIILGIVSAVSILFNICLVLYARGAIIRLLSISEELGDFHAMVDAFANHLKTVYELEMFYGDQTLETLLQHARSFNDQLDTFEYIYSLTEEETQLDENTEQESEEEEEG